MPDTQDLPTPPLSQTEELVALARAGHLLVSEAGTITNPRSGAVYGSNRALKGRYYVLGGTCPVRNQRFTANLHRVVWVYFKGPIPEGMQVNHKDGDTKNNAILNLELSTPSENTRHAVANGSMQQKLGTAGALAIRQLFLTTPTPSKNSIARFFSVDVNMITRVLRNDSYPSDDETALEAAELHEQRFSRIRPTEEAANDAKAAARQKLSTVLALIATGAIEVNPEQGAFHGVEVEVKTYLPSKTMKYASVHVRMGPGKYIMLPAHRLMWAAHRGIPGPKEVVHHKNADKGDFRLSNLELTSTRGNALYSAALGTHEHSKVDEVLATAIRESFLAQPRSANRLCKEFGISQRTARTLLMNESHEYGDPECRARVRVAYEARTAHWRGAGRKVGTSVPRTQVL